MVGDRPAAVLLVDAANVVGSRPDGWWRDRGAAAGRLVSSLRAATRRRDLPAPVVVVLEGAGRDGAEAGESADGVRVVHAPGSGDDEIVDLAAAQEGRVVLVSADRALRRRIEALGGRAVGPGWLLERLAPPA